jgi:hypothetical protein
MRKIPTIFRREEPYAKYVVDEPNPECAWVFAGEGVATRKFDGTCVVFDGLGWMARREVKPGKPIPENFQLVSTDEVTGKTVGWESIEQSSFAKWHADALAHDPHEVTGWRTGTYELVGPKINNNPEKAEHHELWLHADADEVQLADRSFAAIRLAVLWGYENDGAEGIVFHHPDGRMGKIKARDFRLEEN